MVKIIGFKKLFFFILTWVWNLSSYLSLFIHRNQRFESDHGWKLNYLKFSLTQSYIHNIPILQIPMFHGLKLRVIILNQSSVEMVNFKSVTRNQSKNEIFKTEYQALKGRLFHSSKKKFTKTTFYLTLLELTIPKKMWNWLVWQDDSIFILFHM